VKRVATPVLVSSCLLGLRTRYDATDNRNEQVFEYLKRNDLIPIPVCPEQLAGLPTPRPKCWFRCGDGADTLNGTGELTDEHGRDVAQAFLHGAEEALKVARLSNCQAAILQQRSPSCGTRIIYLNEVKTAGIGVTAALLKQNGLRVLGDDELTEAGL